MSIENICNLHKNPVIKLLTEDRFRILRHVCMISVFFVIFASARILFVKDGDDYSGNAGFYHSLAPFILYMGILYINIYVLMNLFFKGQYLLYIILIMALSLSALLTLRYVIDPFFEPYLIRPRRHGLDDVVTFICATIFTTPIILVSNTMRLMQKWIQDTERLNELNTLTINMELAALKNQINPHFLFNMLNNVNVLVKTRPDTASTVIIKLSEFLRHQLYENNEESTSLMAEEQFLTNFLNLEKIRRDNFSFSISHQTPESTANILIPPNLFTTFVENAIKYSVDLGDNTTYVNIALKTEGNRLHFSCINSQNPDEKFRDTGSGGLGLANIKRRLEILYGDNHTLECTDLQSTYTINLTIPYDLYYSR
ncbi:sensor histidine kinase [Flavobacterium psychrotrophum]|uniref:sensor histidine kinase n=1 Tax=Flavobacterium psychrotrophum TaxID=2294119 RepID=UPI000E31C6AC|nr:histidine kinase [Flavobacterium psychrotrophum]